MNQLLNKLYNDLNKISIDHENCFDSELKQLETRIINKNLLSLKYEEIIYKNNLENDINQEIYEDNIINNEWNEFSDIEGTINNLFIESFYDADIAE